MQVSNYAEFPIKFDEVIPLVAYAICHIYLKYEFQFHHQLMTDVRTLVHLSLPREEYQIQASESILV